MTDELENLTGTIEDITYQNESTGFAVIEVDAGDEYVTVVGVLGNVMIGEEAVFQGEWTMHQSFGRQFTFVLNRIIFLEQNHVESIIITRSFFEPSDSLNSGDFAVTASSPGYKSTGKYEGSLSSALSLAFFVKSIPTRISLSGRQREASLPVPVLCFRASFGCIKNTNLTPQFTGEVYLQ